MTLRERLADWISGGALTRAREEALNRLGDTQRKEAVIIQRNHYSSALARIKATTSDGKSGTARKVHRMATEALK